MKTNLKMNFANSDFSGDFAGWPPEATVFPIAGVDLRVLPGAHPFVIAEEAAIRDNWAKETAANPALFDGRLVFQQRLSFSEDGIAGEGYVTPFSAFMWWRRQPQRQGGLHIFAYPVLESADGALVAIRMGAHTANPGQVYFAAGSLEQEDIVDGRCDIEANMRREVHEETGLDLSDSVAGQELYASHSRRTVALMRLFRFDMTAAEMVKRIEAHMLVAEDKEIAGAVAIRSADPSAHPYNIAMLPVISWYFGKAGA
ncbi:DNA mismatch repair protein MutT [Rhizobium leguminosarum bv. trifolii]|uniref:DNA mismatch repair protein MutT n=1 Tax=Rhizobium leguminosarum bv. trifolii TaxID=386 RepID=A0A3E1BI96_RHILT|nr:NUDIX hydrolase [Rhizobium leguminosarum]RFB91563.1 DNA mismatch repair protein MutT [Rhizobium leguminosarum bv. trifolii]RFB92081.1 DNA mismatch repair protein MutT [Rhizobium leguminosarum bv. trifolii]